LSAKLSYNPVGFQIFTIKNVSDYIGMLGTERLNEERTVNLDDDPKEV
jgi:hypothetical protein